DHFIVEIDAHHRVGAHAAGLRLQLGQRFVARVAHGVFISAGPAADDVADAGEKIAEDVGADDDLADDEPEIFADRAAFDGGRGGDDHGFLRVGPQPRFTKLSSTFLGPAFSKSMESLLPSVAVTVP